MLNPTYAQNIKGMKGSVHPNYKANIFTLSLVVFSYDLFVQDLIYSTLAFMLPHNAMEIMGRFAQSSSKTAFHSVF